MSLDPKFYSQQIVQGANAVAAFAAVQSIAFTIALLSAKDMAEIVARASCVSAYLPIIIGIVFYMALVVLCWCKERTLLGDDRDLKATARLLMAGRLVVILGGSIPVILAVIAVRQ